MPAEFDKLRKKIWGSINGKTNPQTKKPFVESDAWAIAVAQWKKTHGGKAPNSNQSNKDWRLMEYYVPITEAVNSGNDFLIRGIAINETTTRNGITYNASELENAAPSFRNKPIMVDHSDSIKDIVGRTTENVNFSSMKKAIEFEGKIMDDRIKEMINDGRITDVSIGAKVNDLVKNEEDGSITAVGLEGLEISLVAIPGDPGANLANALDNSFQLKESAIMAENYLKEIKLDDEETENNEIEFLGEAETSVGGGRDWSKIDKTKLPDSSFAWIETIKGKSGKILKKRHLPYKFADGVISRRGTAAAWAAIKGARGSRTNWPASAVAKINAARVKLGLGKSNQSFYTELNIKKEGKMEEAEKEQTVETVEVESEENTEEKPEEKSEEVTEEKAKIIQVDMSEANKAIAKLAEQVSILTKKVAEQDETPAPSEKSEEDEIPKPSVEDETVGEVGEEKTEDEPTETEECFIVEKADVGRGFQIYRDYSKDSGKFNRLCR